MIRRDFLKSVGLSFSGIVPILGKTQNSSEDQYEEGEYLVRNSHAYVYVDLSNDIRQMSMFAQDVCRRLGNYFYLHDFARTALKFYPNAKAVTVELRKVDEIDTGVRIHYFKNLYIPSGNDFWICAYRFGYDLGLVQIQPRPTEVRNKNFDLVSGNPVTWRRLRHWIMRHSFKDIEVVDKFHKNFKGHLCVESNYIVFSVDDSRVLVRRS